MCFSCEGNLIFSVVKFVVADSLYPFEIAGSFTSAIKRAFNGPSMETNLFEFFLFVLIQASLVNYFTFFAIFCVRMFARFDAMLHLDSKSDIGLVTRHKCLFTATVSLTVASSFFI